MMYMYHKSSIASKPAVGAGGRGEAFRYIYIYTCRDKGDRKVPKGMLLHDKRNREKSAKFNSVAVFDVMM